MEEARLNALSTDRHGLPAEQGTIRNRCFHPTGTFIEFQEAAVEQSITSRFEEQVRKYPDRLAVKTRNHQVTYDDSNRSANRVANQLLAGNNHE